MPAETSSSPYRDITSALTRHTWLGLSYALAAVLLIYALELWHSPSLLFLAFQVPTLAAVTFVIGRESAFRWRLPFLWLITGVMAWAYDEAARSPDTGASFILSVCTLLLLAYALGLAISASREEFVMDRHSGTLSGAVAWLLSAWGCSLQIALIALVPLKAIYADAFSHSSLGAHLVRALEILHLSSPLAWLPAGFLATGLMLFAAIRFSDCPYRALDYSEVMVMESRSAWSEVLAAVRLPVWLVVVIVGFLAHFVSLLLASLKEFADRWLGRFILVFLAVVFPVVTFLCGHYLFLHSMGLVAMNLSGPASRFSGMELLVPVHLMILLALVLYVVAVAPLALARVPTSIDHAWPTIKAYFDQEGFQVAQAVGKSFVLYGIVGVAVPLAALLPHGTGWGAFSIAYVVLIVLLPLSSRLNGPAVLKHLGGPLAWIVTLLGSLRRPITPESQVGAKVGAKRTIK